MVAPSDLRLGELVELVRGLREDVAELRRLLTKHVKEIQKGGA